MATTIFDTFRGSWQVREMANNLRSHAFWRGIIGESTGGRFVEQVFDEDAWRGPVQFFDNSA
jgi:predicted acetyltransferase